MLRVLPLSLRSLLVVTGLAALSGCQTQHTIGKEPQARPAAPAKASPRGLPEGSNEGLPEHLLHEYAARDLAPDAEIRTWDLPAKAKRLIVELLVTAARDELSHLPALMTTQARWGVPDRREYDARPVFDQDDGRVFLDTLRSAASHFSRKENLNCPPIMPPIAQTYVRNGAEPMWCFYASNDGLDILAFKLVLESGGARLDYVGMYGERPARMNARPGAQPPPMTPIVRRAPNTPSRLPELPDGAIPMPPPENGGPVIVTPTPTSPTTQPIIVPGAPPGPDAPAAKANPEPAPPKPAAKANPEPAPVKPATKASPEPAPAQPAPAQPAPAQPAP